MPTSLVYALWAFVAGGAIPVMAVLNGGLGRVVGGPAQAAAILSLVGFVASVAAMVALRAGPPALADVREMPRHLLIGGIIIVFYIISVAVLAPRFGVGNTIMFAVAAQICSSAAIDHFGLFGAAVRPLDTMRILGLLVLLVGLAIVQGGAALLRPAA